MTSGGTSEWRRLALVYLGPPLLVGGLSAVVIGAVWPMAIALLWVFSWPILLAASLLDEDLDHWDWPGDDGPGVAVMFKLTAVSLALAAIPAALLMLL